MSEKLHEALLEKNLYSKSYEEFKIQFDTPERQTLLYNALKDKGLYTKSNGDFLDQFFPIPIEEDLVEQQQLATEEQKEGLSVPTPQQIQDSVSKGQQGFFNRGPDGELLPEGYTMNNLGEVVWVGDGEDPGTYRKEKLEQQGIKYKEGEIPQVLLEEVKVNPYASDILESTYKLENENKEDFYKRITPKEEKITESVKIGTEGGKPIYTAQTLTKYTIDGITKNTDGSYINQSGEPASKQEIIKFKELQILYNTYEEAKDLKENLAGEYSISDTELLDKFDQKKF